MITGVLTAKSARAGAAKSANVRSVENILQIWFGKEGVIRKGGGRGARGRGEQL